MQHEFKRFLGLIGRGEYEQGYFLNSNAAVAKYLSLVMAVVWAFITIWSFISIDGGIAYVQRFIMSLEMACANGAMLAITVHELRRPGRIRHYYGTVLTIYIFIVLALGLVMALLDYASGGQLVMFLVILTVCTCLFAAPPIGSILATTVATVVFAVAANSISPLNPQTMGGLALVWVGVVAISVTHFQQTFAAAVRERDLRRFAILDELTGMRNRRALRLDFSSLVGKEIVAAMIDMDDFKVYNDNYGHTRGDAVLRDMSRMLKTVFPEKSLYRYGGDEFLVLFQGDEERFLEGLNELQRSVDWANRTSASSFCGLSVSVSVGYRYALVESEEMLREMVEQADDDLYQSKLQGKNRVIGAAFDAEQSRAAHRKSGSHDVDSLTGMRNRAAFHRDAARVIGGAQVRGEEAYVAYLDIADFKLYNRTEGYAQGDRLLVQLGEALVTMFPEAVCARLGDDRFVIALSAVGTNASGTDGAGEGAAGAAEAFTISDLRERLENLHERVHALSQGSPVNLKTGLCRIGPEDEDLDVASAADRAKMACDGIKSRPEESVADFDDEMSDRLRWRNYLTNNIDKALASGNVRVFFQPIVRSISGKMCGAEALVRWQDPQYGMISPEEFVKVLESARLIHKVDAFVVEQVCAGYKEQQKRDVGPIVPISVNLSRLDFQLCDMVSIIDEAVGRYGIPRDLIRFEITESALGGSGDLLGKSIDALRERGHEVWIDDFGSGYSSFNCLQEYNFDLLKLDMSFLMRYDGLSEDAKRKTRSILASIVDMCKKIGVKTLAEGVTTPEQYKFLRGLGCEKMQGNYFSPADGFHGGQLPGFVDKLEAEKPEERPFYDAVSRVNVLSAAPLDELDGVDMRTSELPLIIVRQRPNMHFDYLFMNEAYKNMLAERSVSAEESTKHIREEGGELHRAIEACRKLGHTGEIDTQVNGGLYKLRSTCIYDDGETAAYCTVVQGFRRL